MLLQGKRSFPADSLSVRERLGLEARTSSPDFIEAARDHAPVLALSGETPRRLKVIGYWLATPPINN
nr:hypothetical protein [Rhizobium ruizarguesonis]